MSWMEQLVQTYDENERFAGRDGIDGMKAMLPPVGHIVRNAQIEMTLSVDGELIQAAVVPKEKQATLIPCTPDSASRSGSAAFPHALHDTLAYISRDYYDFVKDPPKGNETPYLAYKYLLGAWATLKVEDQKLQAVYRYVTNHDAIHDLIKKKILFQDDSGKLLEKWTEKDGPRPPIFSAIQDEILKSMVRFRVVVDDDDCPELWKDTKLQKEYQDFFQHHFSKMDVRLCYATGKTLPTTGKHSRGIRYPGDNAKLISANDNKGFTFRGRFANRDECVSVGYESSQKVMNVLSWLVRNQGYSHSKKKNAFFSYGGDVAKCHRLYSTIQHV